MKVNMTPNPLDVVTIHASQGDTEARQWEFELHNNGELIDTSDVKEQMFFKAYKGGTEEILPTNGSVPTTAPFLGDIRYPQGLLTDQEFTYRESPTEEDGLAKITDIKGNTLNWNQLVEKGNMTDGWTFSNSTGGYSNNVLTFTVSAKNGFVRPDRPQYIYANHKYFASVDVKATSAFTGRIYFTGHNESFILDPNYTTSWKTFSLVFTNTVTEYNYYPRVFDTRDSGWDAIQIRNCMLIDLTQMGLDISNPSDFTSLFSKPYYDYNQGTLLSFNGSGIKTVGKNLFDFSQFANGTITFENGVLTGTAGQFYTAYDNTVNNGIELKYPKNTQITISFDARTEQNDSPTGGGLYFTASENGTRIQLATTLNTISSIQHKTVTIPSSRHIDKLGWTYGSNPNNIWHITNFQVEFDTETEYEPYTSSTLSLPISTYFPNGMDGVGDAYDELSNSGYAKRMDRIDLGSITYSRVESQTSGVYIFVGAYNSIPNIKNRANSVVWNIKTPLYETVPSTNIYYGRAQNKTIGGYDAQTVRIRDDSFTDATAFKNSLSGQYLVYELATPSETSFTTATLVTENGEVALANENGVLVGKCNSDVSADAGFIEGKIKLSDEDGDVYSNKIQIHVERKP